jgi:hypothetical protein
MSVRLLGGLKLVQLSSQLYHWLSVSISVQVGVLGHTPHLSSNSIYRISKMVQYVILSISTLAGSGRDV